MIIRQLVNSEQDANYQSLLFSNAERQYDFIRSIISIGIAIDRPFLSSQIIKALNFHATTCLDLYSGQYRPHNVNVGDYHPPNYFEVQTLMDDFINFINYNWQEADPISLTAYVLWMMNYIHPFVNGNGRTARASCYFVLCMKIGHPLAGKVMLPELLRRNRSEYVKALKIADSSVQSGEATDLTALKVLLTRLIKEQLNSADN